METLDEDILNILNELGDEEFQEFQWRLQNPCNLEGHKPLPTYLLEKANRLKTVKLIMQNYCKTSKESQIMVNVLKKMRRNDLVKKFLNKPKDGVGEFSGSSLLTTSSQPPQEDLLVKTQEDPQLITFYQDKLKTNVQVPFTCLPQGAVQRQDEKHFAECYTRVSIVHVKDTENCSEHEVMRKKAGQEMQLSEIFKDPSVPNKRIRTVMSIGNAGIGKTFLVHKLVSDWAKEKNQLPHLTFVLQFRQLNLLQGKQFSLAQLIHECSDTTRCIPEEYLNYIFNELQTSGNPNYDESPFKVQFVLDGLDECNMKFDFKTNHECPRDLSQTTSLEELLVNLIRGKLLRCAHIWITTRPAAAKRIPSQFVSMVTEVKGFTNAMKEEYIRRRIGDEKQASKIISNIKSSNSLHAMCEAPVFCSIIADVLRHMLRTDERCVLPKTMVEMYCRFLRVSTKRKRAKYDETLDLTQQEYLEADGAVLLKLGKLAFGHLEKGSFNLIFYQKDLEKCQLDIKEAALYSGLCTEIEIFKTEDCFYQEKVYSFVHLSIQEFLAAVYLFHCFTQKNLKVLETFLAVYSSDISDSFRTLSDFLKAVMIKTLKSKSGHLDLFVRFLHGLSLECNQRLLGGLLGQTENTDAEIKRAINNLKEMNAEEASSADRCINIFQCLMEMKDHSLSQGIQRYLESENRPGKELSEMQCSALATMLQMSEEVLDELYVDTYNTSSEGRLRLIPAVRNVRKARLAGCDLRKTHWDVVASALSSNPSHLKELDLSYNNLCGSPEFRFRCFAGLCDGLKSQHCCLEILRLTHCWLSERCCEVLASALRSNPSLHLKELDLRFNVLTDSALQLFSGLKTLQVNHGGEDWIKPQLLTRPFHHLTLDTNTAYRRLSLSDNNRKVTLGGAQDPPEHIDRFDIQQQVLCTEGLTGPCYWEVEWSGMVSIAVTYKGISRKGGNDCLLGYNDKSWSLECDGYSNSYRVSHNSKQTILPVRPSRGSNKVAVCLDRPFGTVSFYEVSSDSVTHLYTFQNKFIEPLYAGFWVFPYSISSVCLCEQR